MNQSILTKLEQLSMRLEEINALLSDQPVVSDQNQFRELSIEHAQLSPVNDQYQQYLSTMNDINAAQKLLNEDDQDIKEMAEEEIALGENKLDQLELELKNLFSQKILMIHAILLLKFVQELVVMRRVSFQVTFIECIRAMLRKTNGKWKL